jgi:hypothetical protein
MCAAVGSGAGRVAALGRDHRLPHRVRRPRGEHRRRIGVDAGQCQHLLGQSDRECHDVRGAAAAHHLDRLGHLQRVADGPAQRHGHVGEHRVVRRPCAAPMSTIVAASSRARSAVFMNAPEPDFTSSTRPSVPSAIFLLMIELAISGIDSTVPVTSRRA